MTAATFLYPRDSVILTSPPSTHVLAQHLGKLFTVDFYLNPQQFQAMGQFSPAIDRSYCTLFQRAFQSFKIQPHPSHATPESLYEIMGGSLPNRTVNLETFNDIAKHPRSASLMWRVVD